MQSAKQNGIHEEMMVPAAIELLILKSLASLSLQDKSNQQDNRIHEEMLVPVAIESKTLVLLSSSSKTRANSNTITEFMKR